MVGTLPTVARPAVSSPQPYGLQSTVHHPPEPRVHDLSSTAHPPQPYSLPNIWQPAACSPLFLHSPPSTDHHPSQPTALLSPRPTTGHHLSHPNSITVLPNGRPYFSKLAPAGLLPSIMLRKMIYRSGK